MSKRANPWQDLDDFSRQEDAIDEAGDYSSESEASTSGEDTALLVKCAGCGAVLSVAPTSLEAEDGTVESTLIGHTPAKL